MGVKQSKRSVDITEISTKGEIEGFGNEGKVEKITEGVAEKVAANGHVDGDLVNGGESQQNGIEPMQNREPEVASANFVEMKDSYQAMAGVVNGNVENGELNGETEKIDDEPKKAEDKTEKKKDKKEKVVKKIFSFRNFSFSKRDKSKPSKEEKSPERMTETQAEEAPSSPVKEQNATENDTDNNIKPEESAMQINSSTEIEGKETIEEQQQEMEHIPVESEKETPVTAVPSEDLPPPLPASPPPNETVAAEQDSSVITVENTPSSVNAVACTVTNILTEKLETTEIVIKSAEQIAMETGKQIEEKASNLLKTVEERAGESMKAVEEFVSQKTEQIVESCQNANVVSEPAQQEPLAGETAEKVAENVVTAPEKISNVDSLASNAEDSLEKREEGAGESLADIPQDLQDVTEATIEPAETDSLEISAIPPPPPVVEPLTGE